MGVNCSKNTKVKNRRQSLIKFKVETIAMEKPFDTVLISDSMFFNVLIKKMFNDYLKEDELNKKFEIVLLDDSLKIQANNNIYGQLIDSNKLNSSLNKEMKILYDFKTLILLKQREKALIDKKINHLQYTFYLQYVIQMTASADGAIARKLTQEVLLSDWIFGQES